MFNKLVKGPGQQKVVRDLPPEVYPLLHEYGQVRVLDKLSLQQVVDKMTERGNVKLQQLLGDTKVPEVRKVQLVAQAEDKRQKLMVEVEALIHRVCQDPLYIHMEPILVHVLAHPLPPVDDPGAAGLKGRQAEDLAAIAVASELGPNKQMVTGVALVSILEAASQLQPGLKAEVDILIIDSMTHEVDSIYEVKAATGNPYLVLYEDSQKLSSLLELISGQEVRFKAKNEDRAFKEVIVKVPRGLKGAYILCEVGSLSEEGLFSSFSSMASLELMKVLSRDPTVWDRLTVVRKAPEGWEVQVHEAVWGELTKEVVRKWEKLVRSCDCFLIQ